MKQSNSLVRLFEHDTVETMGRFDRTLLLLRKSYEDDPPYFDLRKWAEQTALISEEAILLSRIYPDGQQKATTLSNNAAPVYLGAARTRRSSCRQPMTSCRSATRTWPEQRNACRSCSGAGFATRTAARPA